MTSSTLTREKMAEILSSGKQTISYRGRLLKTVADIPSQAEFALDNPTEAKQAETDILGQMEELKAQLALLKNATVVTVASDEKTTKVRKATEDKSVSTET